MSLKNSLIKKVLLIALFCFILTICIGCNYQTNTKVEPQIDTVFECANYNALSNIANYTEIYKSYVNIAFIDNSLYRDLKHQINKEVPTSIIIIKNNTIVIEYTSIEKIDIIYDCFSIRSHYLNDSLIAEVIKIYQIKLIVNSDTILLTRDTKIIFK